MCTMASSEGQQRGGVTDRRGGCEVVRKRCPIRSGGDATAGASPNVREPWHRSPIHVNEAPHRTHSLLGSELRSSQRPKSREAATVGRAFESTTDRPGTSATLAARGRQASSTVQVARQASDFMRRSRRRPLEALAKITEAPGPGRVRCESAIPSAPAQIAARARDRTTIRSAIVLRERLSRTPGQ